MGAVIALAKPCGRVRVQDGRRAFDLFPTRSDGKRAWLFAIGFTDGRVKFGVSARPRHVMQNYWTAVDGRVEWAHVFGTVSRGRWQGRCRAETLALRNAAVLGRRLQHSQFFRGLDRSAALRCGRAAVAEAEQGA